MSAAATASIAVESRAPGELRPHQYPQVPPLTAVARNALRDDIARRGIVEPLEISGSDIVLNGRERLAVATELGLEYVPARVVRPAHEVEHIILGALQRRHLSASQRAALALDLDQYRQLRSDAETRRLGNLRQNAETAVLPPRGKTRDHVAAFAGVSARTVQDAATVQTHNPQLFERIKTGEIAADLAARRIRRALRDANLPPAQEAPAQAVYASLFVAYISNKGGFARPGKTW